MDDAERNDDLPLSTVESLVAAMIEAGPEVAEHMVKAANELILAAQAITAAAERRLAEQRQRQDADGTARDEAEPEARDRGAGPVLRPIDDVA